jgi:hypothetical protein
LAAFSELNLLGVIKDATGSYGLGLLPLVALTAAGSIVVVVMGRGDRRRVAAASAS